MVPNKKKHDEKRGKRGQADDSPHGKATAPRSAHASVKRRGLMREIEEGERDLCGRNGSRRGRKARREKACRFKTRRSKWR